MIGMGIGRVMVAVVMVMVMAMGNRDAIGLAGTGAFALAKRAAFGQPFHVMVMAFLGPADVLLKPKHLSPVFAEGAIHRCVASQHLLHPFSEGVHHHRVIAQVTGGQEFNLGVIVGHEGGVLTNPAHQHAREQEIGHHNNAFEAQLHHMPKTGFHQGEGDTRKHGFAPAKAKSLNEHPRHLGHVGVGIWIG